jgi:hypothetical protein
VNIDEVTDEVITSTRRTVPIYQGTWTPVLAGSSVAGTNTYTQQTGYYQVVGDSITLHGVIELSALDGALAGDIRITGLPNSFASSFTGGLTAAAVSEWGNITLTTNYTYLGGRLTVNQNFIEIVQSGSGEATIALDETGLANTSAIVFSITYPFFYRIA